MTALTDLKVLDKGRLIVVDVLGGDKTVVNAARVSYANADWYGSVMNEKDEKLIQYLAKHKHVSPFYHPHISFVCKAPISVQRQAFKHKIGTAENSESTRYTEVAEEFYVPVEMRAQSTKNKQGSEGVIFGSPVMAMARYKSACESSFRTYNALIEDGVARELAREVLPLATYTSWFWTMSLAAVAHFIQLRDEEHAQWEIRQYAIAMKQLVMPLFPLSMKALLDQPSS